MPQKVLALITFFMSVAIIRPALGEEEVFTYRAPESDSDLRYNYDKEALQLALEKTKHKYGSFKLVQSPSMNFARSIDVISKNSLPNFFIKLSYEDRFSSLHMIYSRFPVDLGIVGYRVCFTSADKIENLKKIKTIEDLKKFSHGQGLAWADTQILRDNGFKVEEVSNYEGLFKMVASGRFDLFCRGSNELLDEWNSHKDVKNLTYDESFTIVYPLPRFFYTNSANVKAAQRIQEGLVIAYNDGSLIKAWRRNYNDSINFVKLHKRKVFRLENPLLKKVDFDYKKYFFDPFKK